MAARKCFAVLAIKTPDVVVGEGGYVVDKKTGINFLYFSRNDALDKARDEAERNPKVPYIVLEATTVIEAKKPELMSKDFKDNGELLPTKSEVVI